MEKATEFMKRKIKKQKNLIEGILPKGVTVFSGGPKIRKNIFVSTVSNSSIK